MNARRTSGSLIADTSISRARVARELTALIAEYGKPKMIVSDYGSEFTSTAILAWAGKAQVEWHRIAPGKPLQNAFIQSINGRLRDELLNETLFSSLPHARDADALVRSLQHLASTRAARRPNSSRIRRSVQTTTGSGAALHKWLRADARRIPRPGG